MTLKELREQANLSRAQVAKKAFVDTSCVTHWELGDWAPPKKYHSKLAKMYSVTPEEIKALADEIITAIIGRSGCDAVYLPDWESSAIILEIVKAVPQIIAGIVTAFTESIPKIVEVGENLVRGLWEGIQSLASWLWDKVSGWIYSIWDGICDFFGIHSPSKEMGWIGEMLVEGLAGSLDKNGKDAVKSAEHLADGISSVMQDMYRQVLDLYATSVDYDPRSSESVAFFKMVQNKLHYAAHGHTAAEVIYGRADADKPFMGLTAFSGDFPTAKDIGIAKNYLTEEELQILNGIVSGYFDFAEVQAMRHRPMHILSPMPAVFFRYNCSRNICQTLKFHPLARAHSTFFKGFSFCRFKWRFVILTAPGNKLPLVVICTMEHTIIWTTIDDTVRYGKNLKWRSHDISP